MNDGQHRRNRTPPDAAGEQQRKDASERGQDRGEWCARRMEEWIPPATVKRIGTWCPEDADGAEEFCTPWHESYVVPREVDSENDSEEGELPGADSGLRIKKRLHWMVVVRVSIPVAVRT